MFSIFTHVTWNPCVTQIVSLGYLCYLTLPKLQEKWVLAFAAINYGIV